jgi:MOSC domain-containing protein YiiM
LEARALARATPDNSSPRSDLPEDSILIGDRFSVGSAEVVVTQPRLPCYKLGVKFQMDDMVKRFLASRRTGFYLAVVREGEVGAGDDIELIERYEYAVPVSAITRSYVAKSTMPGAWIALCGLQPCQKVGRATSANV